MDKMDENEYNIGFCVSMKILFNDLFRKVLSLESSMIMSCCPDEIRGDKCWISLFGWW
jgi:hypothetical protein